MKDEMDAYNDSIDEMWYEIKNAPTIEIVRCKDCVEGSYKTVIDGDNVKWCDIVGMNVLDDDFCSWARMKGGDADIPKNQSIMQQSRHDDGKDLISRADAIAYIDRIINSGLGRNKSLDYIHKYISALPSADAEPTVIRAKTFMRKEDFDKWAEDIKKQNKSIVCIPCDAEVVSDDVEHGEWKHKPSKSGEWVWWQCSEYGRFCFLDGYKERKERVDNAEKEVARMLKEVEKLRDLKGGDPE